MGKTLLLICNILILYSEYRSQKIWSRRISFIILFDRAICFKCTVLKTTTVYRSVDANFAISSHIHGNFFSGGTAIV